MRGITLMDNQPEPESYINRNGYKRHKKPDGWQPTNPDKCQGFSSGSGKQCKNRKPKNGRYCYRHGKKGARGGTNNPNYKHGGHSKVINKYVTQLSHYPEMLDTFLASVEGENQTDATPAIAAMDAVIMAKLETINFGDLKELGILLTDVKDLLKKAMGAVGDYETAAKNSDPVQAGLSFNSLKVLIRTGLSKINANKNKLKAVGLEELEKTLERRTKMAHQKVEMETKQSQAVPPEVNLILINLIVADMMAVIFDLIEDEYKRNEIITAFDQRLSDN